MKLTLRFVFSLVLVTLLACSFAPQAFADNIDFIQGNQLLQNEENILFQADMQGTTIMGFTNQTNTEIDFSSTTDVLMGQGSQARVEAQERVFELVVEEEPRLSTTLPHGIGLRHERPSYRLSVAHEGELHGGGLAGEVRRRCGS